MVFWRFQRLLINNQAARPTPTPLLAIIHLFINRWSAMGRGIGIGGEGKRPGNEEGRQLGGIAVRQLCR